jgi:transposase
VGALDVDPGGACPAGQDRAAGRRRDRDERDRPADRGVEADGELWKKSVLALRPGIAEKATHDYVRHGTTTLFAALETATGKVTGACYPRHRHQEFLAFLRQVAKAYPRRQLHIVTDNYGTHKHQDVQDWLAKNPRITLHFTP